MSDAQYDVAIIGAGPAGCTVSTLLKKYASEMKVIVLEREKFPRDHIGESLLPAINPVLIEMDAWDKVEAQGFSTQLQKMTVQVGNTTSGDVSLRAGAADQVVDIVAEGAPIIDKSNYKIDGVITRQKIDALPLNGRNFLQLALLEPGVGVSVSTPGNANNLFNVSIGGADPALTRITVDGGSVLDYVTGGAAQNFSTQGLSSISHVQALFGWRRTWR